MSPPRWVVSDRESKNLFKNNIELRSGCLKELTNNIPSKLTFWVFFIPCLIIVLIVAALVLLEYAGVDTSTVYKLY